MSGQEALEKWWAESQSWGPVSSNFGEDWNRQFEQDKEKLFTIRRVLGGEKLYSLEQLGLASVPDPARAIENARKALAEAADLIDTTFAATYSAPRGGLAHPVAAECRAALAGLGGTT